MAELIFVTYRELPEGTADDRGLLPLLAEAGVTARFAPWDDPGADWAGARLVVLRSTWDYFRRPAEFFAWIDALEAASARVANPAGLVRWNADKRYLFDLEQAGLAIAPTELVSRRAPARLAEIAARRGWDDLVVKPTISGGAFRTRRISASDLASGEALLAEILSEADGLVQPYLPAVETEGERSLIFLGGRFSHAIRKAPFTTVAGLRESRHAPSDEELAFARRALDAVGGALLYARVDILPSPNGPRLMELELIEPHLFLELGGGHQRFASVLADAVFTAG